MKKVSGSDFGLVIYILSGVGLHLHAIQAGLRHDDPTLASPSCTLVLIKGVLVRAYFHVQTGFNKFFGVHRSMSYLVLL